MADGRPRALIVEDEEYCFRLLVNGLDREGYAVVPAVAWHPALQAIVDNDLEFAVIDIVLRGDVDGLMILDALRKHAKHKDLPVVVVSGRYPAGHGIEEDVAQLRAVYLGKPFTLPQLMEAVERAKEMIAGTHGVSDYKIQTMPILELPSVTDLSVADTLP